MSTIGDSTRLHMRCDDALIMYRHHRGSYFQQRREYPLQMPPFRFIGQALHWRARWSQLAEVIDAELQFEQRDR